MDQKATVSQLLEEYLAGITKNDPAFRLARMGEPVTLLIVDLYMEGQLAIKAPHRLQPLIAEKSRPAVARHLTRWFTDPDVGVRLKALEIFGMVADQAQRLEHLNALHMLTGDRDPRVQSALAHLLSHVPAAIPTLKKLQAQAQPDLQEQINLWLAQLGDHTARERLAQDIAEVETTTPEATSKVRYEKARILAELKDERVIPYLMGQLRSAQPPEQIAGIRLAGLFPAPSLAPALIELLASDYSPGMLKYEPLQTVGEDAYALLERMGEAARPALLKASTHPNPVIQRQVKLLLSKRRGGFGLG